MKTRKILGGIAFVAAMFVGHSTMAQDASTVKLDSEWSLLAEENGVQFFAKKETCPTSTKQLASTYAFVKVVNTTNQDVMVEWQMGIKYDLECVGCVPHNESIVGTSVPANSSVEGDCTFSQDLSRYISMVDNPHESRKYEGVQLITFKLH